MRSGGLATISTSHPSSSSISRQSSHSVQKIIASTQTRHKSILLSGVRSSRASERQIGMLHGRLNETACWKRQRLSTGAIMAQLNFPNILKEIAMRLFHGPMVSRVDVINEKIMSLYCGRTSIFKFQKLSIVTSSFFSKGFQSFILPSLAPIRIPKCACWKVMLLLVSTNRTIASCFPDFAKHIFPP